MKSQVLHTVWCNISGEAAGEIWHWSLLGVKGLNVWLSGSLSPKTVPHSQYHTTTTYYSTVHTYTTLYQGTNKSKLSVFRESKLLPARSLQAASSLCTPKQFEHWDFYIPSPHYRQVFIWTISETSAIVLCVGFFCAVKSGSVMWPKQSDDFSRASLGPYAGERV